MDGEEKHVTGHEAHVDAPVQPHAQALSFVG